MKRLAVACVLSLIPTCLFAQEPVPSLTAADVRWEDVVDIAGHHRTIPVLSRPASSEAIRQPSGRVSMSEPSSIIARDEQWRTAKAAGDRSAIEAIAADNFSETSADAIGRNKSQAVQSWAARGIRSIAGERATIRISGNVGTVTGEELEIRETGAQRIVFSRVYLRLTPSSEWSLFSSTEIFR
jgi:hypothetical protein